MLELKEYQKTAVSWCLSKESSCAILAYEMGMGKTIISCEVIKTYPLRTLILAPPALIPQWQKELFGHKIQSAIYHGPNKGKFSKISSDIVISTSATIANIAEDIMHNRFERLIIDEAHFLRNRQSKIYKCIYN